VSEIEWNFVPFLPLNCFTGHFKEIRVAGLLLRRKSNRVEKFQECQLTDVAENSFGEDWRKN